MEIFDFPNLATKKIFGGKISNKFPAKFSLKNSLEFDGNFHRKFGGKFWLINEKFGGPERSIVLANSGP